MQRAVRATMTMPNGPPDPAPSRACARDAPLGASHTAATFKSYSGENRIQLLVRSMYRQRDVSGHAVEDRGPMRLSKGPIRALRRPKEPTRVEHLKQPFQMLHPSSLSGPSLGPPGTIMRPQEASGRLQNWSQPERVHLKRPFHMLHSGSLTGLRAHGGPFQVLSVAIRKSLGGFREASKDPKTA